MGRFVHSLSIASGLASVLWASACTDMPAPGPSAQPGNVRIQPVVFHDTNRSAISGDVPTAAAHFVRNQSALTGPGDDWQVRTMFAGTGTSHVRLDQTHDGIPVWGSDIVAHTKDGAVDFVSGNRVAGLDGFDTTAELTADTAVATAKSDYSGAALVRSPLAYKREASRLVIYPHAGEARLAWHVQFYTEKQAGIAPGRWNYFIDAKTGELLHKYNNLQTAVQQASGPGGNAKVARTWTNQLDVTPTGGVFAMDTPTLQTFDMDNGTDNGTLVTGPLNPVSDAPIDDAHGFAEITLQFLHDAQGFNSIDNKGFLIKSRVHFDVNFENAFWNGTEMTYGDGATTFFPLSGALDVVAHEIDHGFTEFHSNLIYEKESGGMNESFSDIAGTAAEFFFAGTKGDFDLGRDIFKGNDALRFMCDPTKDGVSIDNFANYNDNLDVHFSSGISNKAFCLSARRIASGSPNGTATPASVQRASTAWFRANAAFWTQSTGFVQACQGVMDASRDLGFSTAEQTALRQSWADVGVNCDNVAPGGPNVDITSPKNGATVASTFDVTLDTQNTVSVDVGIDGQKLGTVTMAPFSFQLTMIPAGSHMLQVIAKDSANKTANAQIQITVSDGGLGGGNPPPPPPPPVMHKDSGGCSAAGGGSGIGMALALLAFVRRRRR